MKYKQGDVLQFGSEWLIILDESDSDNHPNVTIGPDKLFLGGYNPQTDCNCTLPVLFNIFDIKKKVEEYED